MINEKSAKGRKEIVVTLKRLHDQSNLGQLMCNVF